MLALPALGVELPLAEIYAGIEFGETPAATASLRTSPTTA